MRPGNPRCNSLLAASLVAVLVTGSLVVLSACNGEPADDWIVVHANRVDSSSTSGGASDTCTLVTGKEAAYLPVCMHIEEGMKIGFANYYNDGSGGKKATFTLEPSVFGVATLDLEYQETKVLEVVATPPVNVQILVVIQGTKHGGPVMIPKKSGGRP